MADIIFPTSLDFGVGNVDFAIRYNVQIEVARDDTITRIGLPGGRWLATVRVETEVEHGSSPLRPRIEALIASLEGGANRLIMPHFGRPRPNGSLTGAPTIGSTLLKGAKSMTVVNANGTFKTGDVIGLPGQLLLVTADATPVSGNMTVSFVPPVRAQHNSGTPVGWNRPTTYWIPTSPLAGPFPYAMNKQRPAFSFELVEVS